MKGCKDLEFLNSYHKELTNVSERIKKELPKINNTIDKSKILSTKPLIFLVNFSDLGNSWSPKDIISRCYGGNSTTLEALADKMSNMITKGRSVDIKPMLDKIASGRLKKLSKPQHNGAEFLGHGSFRWNNKAYSLDKIELYKLNEFIKDNY